MKPQDIHRLLGEMQVPRKDWDNNQNFMDWCEKKVGKRHLDQMTSRELIELSQALMKRYHWYGTQSGRKRG